MDRLAATRGLCGLWPAVRLSCGASRRIPRLQTLPRLQSLQRLQRQNQSTVAAKPYYVTTPIFYVNADPHVGHLFSMVLADVFKRWQTLQGRPALLCTGTDEHGMKVQQAAARAGLAPKLFCDENAAVFADLARRAQIDNDFFIRTTDADHATAVQAFWQRLQQRGYIYQSKHAGWYCVSDETYYPETMVEKRIAPLTGRVEMVSVETGKTVEWTEETNYHFRMTAVRDRLLAFYAAHPDFVVPAARMSEVVNWVTNNLEDLSISRPASRLTWGIPVPGDPSQTIYVWVDALVNYLTKAGYPGRWRADEATESTTDVATTAEPTEAETAGGWPADVHVLGKDIVRFHAVYWPALLLATDLPLPRQMLSHAHWTLGRKKMSKSDGNVVHPFYAMDRFGVDAIRYYLVHDGGIEQDADYGNEHIVERYKKGLQGGLGNLLGRVTRTTRWSVREAVQQGLTDTRGFGSMDRMLAAQKMLVAQTAKAAARPMDRLDARAALHVVMDTVYQTNKFVSETAPWMLAKEREAAETDVEKNSKTRLLNEVVYLAAEAVRVAGILLQPVMPTKAAEVLDVLGVAPSRRTFADARLGVDSTYGVPIRPPGKGRDDGLFPPLPVEN